MFETYLKENQEQKKFLSESEKCKTEEDRIHFCQKYLEGKGYSFDHHKKVKNQKDIKIEEDDFFDNLMDRVVPPPQLPAYNPISKNVNFLEYHYSTPEYKMLHMDRQEKAIFMENVRGVISRGLSHEIEKQGFIKYITTEDLYLHTHIITGRIGVVKQ